VDASKKKQSVAALSIASNTTLVIGKIVVGLVTGSVSVLSEAIHSGMDLLAALIAFVAVRTSGRPADDEHPWGHEKVENLSGAFEAILIFVAALWIIWESIDKLIHPRPIDAIGLGVAVMGISTAVNVLVSRALFRVGKETDSIALLADAWHLRTDVYTSMGVMIGLAFIWLGSFVLPSVNLALIDPVVAIAVALLIGKTAIKLTRQSVADLLDTSMPEEERAWIADHLSSQRPEVCGFHRLRTRRAGAKRFVVFHLLVDAEMHVNESHGIADRVSAGIYAHFPGCHVTVHVEPCDGSCRDVCVEGCLLSEDERAAVAAGRCDSSSSDE
jgi:cation diffusion facilitator family transporter